MQYFYLIRHGQTDLNVKHYFQGNKDIGVLTQEGQQQAREAGKKLKKYPIKKAYCSPLTRARHSFELINETLQLDTLDVLPDLIERSFGIYEGQHVDALESTADKEALETMHAFHEVPEGETLHNAGARLFKTMEGLSKATDDGHYLVVTHGNCITALKWLLKADKKSTLIHMKMGNCEFIKVSCKDGEFKLIEELH